MRETSKARCRCIAFRERVSSGDRDGVGDGFSMGGWVAVVGVGTVCVWGAMGAEASGVRVCENVEL